MSDSIIFQTFQLSLFLANAFKKRYLDRRQILLHFLSILLKFNALFAVTTVCKMIWNDVYEKKEHHKHVDGYHCPNLYS